MIRSATLLSIPCSFVLLAGACASQQVPAARFADTQASISAAHAVGAEHEPRAALHLKMAKDQLAEARAFAKNGDDDEAELALARAAVDAETALMVTREAAARRDVEKSNAEIRDLSN
jgi:hypothetical protein